MPCRETLKNIVETLGAMQESSPRYPFPDDESFQGSQYKPRTVPSPYPHDGTMTHHLYVISLRATKDGNFVTISPTDPYKEPYDEDKEYGPTHGYLDVKVSYEIWRELMVGMVIPMTLNF